MKKKKNKNGQKEIDNLSIDSQHDLTPVPKEQKGALVAYDPLQMYLWEMRRYKLLTKAEEIELAIRYRQKNDPEAAHKLILSNLRLVVKIAMDFHRYWMKNLMDL
ncbi:MAG: RNA polymerase subunit sigma-70, partial [Deltaproteobacteria bacterium]|nr:RNA polymerase subunit sigma-70 [Deltaproteobacteria bacterium]